MAFQVIPAIDIRGGRCVRLFQGDYSRETSYPEEPVRVAHRWASAGAPLIHVVDLDGARAGAPANNEIIAAICRSVAVPIEVSGGLRSISAVTGAVAAGAARVQLGSAAVRDPDLVVAVARAFPGRLVVAIDARGGEVMTDGWERSSGRTAIELAREMEALGVPRLMFTDIARDGAMQGPNIEAFADLVAAVSVPVVASGGVTSIEHLRSLADVGCEGAIIGRALYEGTIDLAAAIEALAAC